MHVVVRGSRAAAAARGCARRPHRSLTLRPAYSLPTDVLVGGIACRFEKSGTKVRLYIMTLGVLAPYRGRGVGQRLLVRALNEAAKEAEVEDVYLHVQVSNTEAVAFYKKFGFEVTETVANYYKRLTPPDCFILSRSMRDWVPPVLAIEGDDTTDITMDAP